MHFVAKVLILFSCLLIERAWSKDTHQKIDISSELSDISERLSADNVKDLLITLVDQHMEGSLRVSHPFLGPW
jgi:hypothetical protein